MTEKRPHLSLATLKAGVWSKLNISGKFKATSRGAIELYLRDTYSGFTVHYRLLNQAIDEMLAAGELKKLQDGRLQLVGKSSK